MDRRASRFTLLAAFTLAACSPDLVAPVMTPGSPSFAKSVSTSGRYIVLVDAAIGGDAFAARVAAAGGKIDSFHAGSGFAVVTGLSPAGATQLSASGVGGVQADFQVAVVPPAGAAEADVSEVASEINSVENPATGVRYSWQWNMRSINASAAWMAGKLGSATVTVAILDTGIDYDAPDLNGLVDLTRSKSFMDVFVGLADNPATPAQDGSPVIPSDNAIIAATFPTRNLIADLNGHGTNVATQVSSKAPVHAGVTSKTTLIGVKVLGANGYGEFSRIMNGVLWAADQGADVANMSLGGGFGRSHDGQTIAAINRVFNYAKDQGMLVVVSAGNNGVDLQHNGGAYATYCDAPHVMCVSALGPRLAGATQDQNEPAYYTTFGRNSVDIAAPGGNADAPNFTLSAWPWGNDIASWVWSYCAKQRIAIARVGTTAAGIYAPTACALGNRVTGYIGTSQAAPHVAGLAALLVAEHGANDPVWIKKRIIESAAPINPVYGRGRIDVKAALGL
jgi:hypothetical protein